MYAQFRSQFPMGSLISELLNIHEGKYIVRASIQVGGSTLATGLSAATNIEQAEDQARARALVVLGIEDRPYPTQAQIINREIQEPAAHSHRARLNAPSHSAEFLPLADTAFQPSLEVDWSIAEQAARTFPSPEQPQLPWFDPHLAPESAPPQRSERPRGQISNPSARPEAPSTALAAPIDLSDIIAQTDVELKRLNWTNAQGRRYLEQTYGKRSRQHLSDAELMEFLDYLKTQPAPGKPMG
jgi:hypothetical protein